MRRSVTALLTVLLLLAAACAGGTDTASTTGEASSDGAGALAFTAATVGGGTFEGGEYAGQDLMLWFWAPW